MVSFISFITSAIILVALQCLTLLTDADFRQDNDEAVSALEDWSAKMQLVYITFASACFSLGLLALGAILDRKDMTRSFAFFCFIPATQLSIETYILGEDQLTTVQLVCMITLLVGTLLITCFLSQHKPPPASSTTTIQPPRQRNNNNM